MRGVFLDLDSVHPTDLELDTLQSCLDEWQLYPATDEHQIDAHIADAHVVVTNKVPLAREQLMCMPDLKLICVAATGTNNIDLDAARDAGIAVCNARNYATASVTEAVFTMLLTLTRQLDNYRQRVDAGDWADSPHFCLFDQTIEELRGKTLGIIGHGALGQSVERLARAFSMQVLIAQRLNGPPIEGRVALEQLLAEADAVSLHCPLSNQTRRLIGRYELQAMKDSALLINTARGGIVDEFALVEALQKRWIAGAGVDVLSTEPPREHNPLLDYRSPRLIITPHIAWASRSARQQLLSEIASNIHAFQAGEIRNQVA
jgi:glycerate dehydrogenase